jgi:hypothetical protein
MRDRSTTSGALSGQPVVLIVDDHEDCVAMPDMLALEIRNVANGSPRRTKTLPSVSTPSESYALSAGQCYNSAAQCQEKIER